MVHSTSKRNIGGLSLQRSEMFIATNTLKGFRSARSETRQQPYNLTRQKPLRSSGAKD